MPSWVPDLGSPRSRDSKYLNTIVLYGQMKYLMGQALSERTASHNEIMLQLDEMQT
jgi:hypothetical protein